MKFRNLFLTVVAGIFVLVAVACDNNGGGNVMSSFTDDFELHDMTYYGVEGAHQFYYMTMDEALAITTNADFNGVLYFGFPGCPWCQAGIPVLHEAINVTDVPVFYVSRRHALREGIWNEWDEQMANWLNEQVDLQWIYTTPATDATDEERENFVPEPIRPNIFVPFVVHIRNGVVVNSHRGTFEGHARMEEVEGRPTYPFTDAQHATLLARYVEILNGVNADEGCNLFASDDCE